MALKLTTNLRQRLTERQQPEREEAPTPRPEPEKPVSAPASDAMVRAVENMQSRNAQADQRLAEVLDAAAQRLMESVKQPRVGYKMKHTFKRDERGRIVSAETIVTPLDDRA